MKLATQEALTTWLDQLAEQNTLIAPRNEAGILLYTPVKRAGEITFEFTRPKMSAKEAVFPSTQRILSIEKHGKDVTLSEPVLDKPQVVFGLRPCDARGIAVLDSVFVGREPVDASYARRREATTLIGLACPQMWDTCFCGTMGSAPDDASQMDVMLTKTGNAYAVNAVTEKGKQIVAGLAMNDSDAAMAAPNLNPQESLVNQAKLPEHFRDGYWDLLAERCIGCRVCAYVCPTCRCFDVRDQVVERRTNHSLSDRVRCWDSCTGANYRVVAGGANPRSTKGQRLRNRFFCKLYYVPQGYGSDGCVGCGRCVESCPVNIDIVEVMRDLARAEVAA
jgi:sulfhydrogenase subunit beta (sulfur reductase)